MQQKLTILKGKDKTEIMVATGSNLKESLLAKGFTPYTTITSKLNCGGRGICATCGVWIHKPNIPASHWHDRLAKKYGYSRLSCQIQVETDMVIELDSKKRIWGTPRK